MTDRADAKFLVYKIDMVWTVPDKLFPWCWRRPTESQADGHRHFPFRWTARLAGWWCTRG